MKKRILKIYKWTFIIGFLYVLFIYATDTMIPCSYYSIFGIKCPGCGLTRMFLSLLKLDIASAFFYNPFMFIMLIGWNIVGIIAIFGKLENANPRYFKIAGNICLILALIFGIVRNFF
ncbi:MAG: DUF2752 domain-containing protein [Ruminococcaceae bacterium]|nr:DUF2752 domain-containing protein [Oscillospiraceae bacterium]